MPTSSDFSNDHVIYLVEEFCETFATESGDPTMGLQQFRLLLALGTHRSLNQNDLPKYTGVAKSSNGRNIDRLGAGSIREQGLGFLKSEEDPKDRRFKVVQLTKTGSKLLESCARAAKSAVLK